MTQPDSRPRPPRRAEWRWRVPGEGLWWIILAGVLTGLGVLKTINLLTLLGCCLLSAIALNALAAGRGLGRLRARRRLAGPLVAGEPCPVEVEVGNPARPVRIGLRLEDRGPTHALEWFVPRLAGGAVERLPAAVSIPRRGRYRWGALVVESGYPFGLVRRRRELIPEGDVVVWPRTGRLDRVRFLRFLRGAPPTPDRCRGRSRPHPHAQAEFFGLRAYRPGDSPRAIHWRSSARRGELLVRECEEPAADDLILVFDPSPVGGTPDRFEDALSLAATVCRTWCGRPGTRLMLVVAGAVPAVLDGFTSPGHERRLLDRLAVEEPGDPAGREALAHLLTAARLPHSPVVLIAGGPSGLAEVVHRALKRPVSSLDVARATALGLYEPPPAARAEAAAAAAAH